jgi:hypothetical protein
MAQLPRYPCPRCGRPIAATTSSLYASLRDGRLVRYVYLRTHNDDHGEACPGATAAVSPPLIPACLTSERTVP